jgi:hypothetical protein
LPKKQDAFAKRPNYSPMDLYAMKPFAKPDKLRLALT